MKELLVLVNWHIFSEDIKNDNSCNYYEIFNEETEEDIILNYEGINENANFWISEIGASIFDEQAFKIVKEYIKKERTKPEISMLGGLVRDIWWEEPKLGEFIMVLKMKSYQCNHPLDPVEWNVDIECVGILGEQVKLTY